MGKRGTAKIQKGISKANKKENTKKCASGKNSYKKNPTYPEWENAKKEQKTTNKQKQNT